MQVLHIGIDVGSTTAKIVVLNSSQELLYSEYRRHYSDIKTAVTDLVREAYQRFPVKNHRYAWFKWHLYCECVQCGVYQKSLPEHVPSERTAQKLM